MTNHVDGVEGLAPAAGAATRAYEMAQVAAQDMSGQENLARLAESALSRAIARPDTTSPLDNVRSELTESARGQIGDLKGDLLSTVERPGAETPAAETASEDMQAQTEVRVRELYYDLTNYQVAWKIAQRMQQDITQLLRG